MREVVQEEAINLEVLVCVEGLSCALPRKCLQQSQYMKQSLHCLVLEGIFVGGRLVHFQKCLEDNRRLMVSFCYKKRVQDSFYKELLSFPNSCFPRADRKSSTGARGQRTPSQRGSGENKPRRSRISLSNFLGSQEKREIKTYNRSGQTEFLPRHSVFQNGNRKHSQAIESTQRLGIYLDLTDTYLISSLGLIIKEDKSDLTPAQNFVYIG